MIVIRRNFKHFLNWFGLRRRQFVRAERNRQQYKKLKVEKVYGSEQDTGFFAFGQHWTVRLVTGSGSFCLLRWRELICLRSFKMLLAVKNRIPWKEKRITWSTLNRWSARYSYWNRNYMTATIHRRLFGMCWKRLVPFIREIGRASYRLILSWDCRHRMFGIMQQPATRQKHYYMSANLLSFLQDGWMPCTTTTPSAFLL